MKVKKNKEKQLNPFELHLNHKKFTILGRKSKNDVGKPGTARSKSIQKVYRYFCVKMYLDLLNVLISEKENIIA